MSFDYRKLKGRITEVFGTQTEFAKKMGWSERTLSLKMTGKVFWKQSEICKAINLLGVQNEEIPIYFFNEKVQ